jgi:hypothetical protein
MVDFRSRSLVKFIGASALSAMLIACSSGGSKTTSPFLGASALSGSYVFTATGSDSSDGDYSVVGSFVADGKGNITSAVADYNLGSGIDSNVPLTGTYVAGNGVAVITLTDSASLKDSFTTTLVSSGSTPIQNFDGSGSGTLYPQTATSFSPAGTYSFSVSGEGEGIVTGSGQFVAASSGTFTSGTLTYTDSQTSINYPAVTGFLNTPETGGRGLASLEGNNLAYYVISPNQIQMIGLDEHALLNIPATKQ